MKNEKARIEAKNKDLQQKLNMSQTTQDFMKKENEDLKDN